MRRMLVLALSLGGSACGGDDAPEDAAMDSSVPDAGAEGDAAAMDAGAGGDLVVDGDFVYVVTEFQGSFALGTETITSAGNWDALLAAFDTSDGSVSWAQRFGGVGDDRGWGVAVGPGGDIYFTGRYTDTIDFGGGPLPLYGGDDVYVAPYSLPAEILPWCSA